jgi:hypothetical protein
MRAFVKLTVFIDKCTAANCNVPESDYYDKPMKIMLVYTQYASFLKPGMEMDRRLFA